MAKVKALCNCFVDSTFRSEGEVFDYEGPKNPHLEPVKGSKKESTGEPATSE
jgi:hypothetical protein